MTDQPELPLGSEPLIVLEQRLRTAMREWSKWNARNRKARGSDERLETAERAVYWSKRVEHIEAEIRKAGGVA